MKITASVAIEDGGLKKEAEREKQTRKEQSNFKETLMQRYAS
jgi:hypothetical protein